MRVLLISSNSIHLYNYYTLIKGAIESIDIITDSRKPEFDYGNNTVHYVNFSFRKGFFFNKEIKAVEKIIRDRNIDIVHAHQAVTHAYIAAKAVKKTKTPLIVTIWGSDILLVPRKSIFHKLMSRYILKKASHLTMDAAFLQDHMEEIARRKLQSTIVTYGVDIPDKVNITDKEDIFYSNRLLEPIYNIDLIINTFSNFVSSKEYNGYKLVIAGNGSLEQSMKELAEKKNIADQVIFAGWLNKEQNHEFYQKTRFFVSVPESDGTSVSLLEAMAYGCIPIVSDLPANREWVKDGYNGIIAKPGDQNFMNNCLILDFEKIPELNHREIAERAGKNSTLNTFINLYKTVLR